MEKVISVTTYWILWMGRITYCHPDVIKAQFRKKLRHFATHADVERCQQNEVVLVFPGSRKCSCSLCPG